MTDFHVTVELFFKRCLFLAVLRLCCFPFSSCGEQGLPLLVATLALLALSSGCGAQALSVWASGRSTQAQSLWPTGFIAPQHMESYWTRDRTPVLCTGRRVLILYAIREVDNYRTLKNYTSTPHSLF